MNREGLQLACRYSFNCQHAKHFGMAERLREFSLGNLKEDSARNILERFDSYRFYKTIAEINGVEDPFDQRVISYYWRGRPKLDGELWHNFTTLMPISNLPSEHIDVNLVDDCFVHQAVVNGIFPDRVVVKYFPVEIRDKKLVLAERPNQKEVKNIFFAKLKAGDPVTIHFSHIIEKLDIVDARAVTVLTHRSLDKFNKLRARNKV